MGGVAIRALKLSWLQTGVLFWAAMFVLLVAACFPYDTDPQQSRTAAAVGAGSFYDSAYEVPKAPSQGAREDEAMVAEFVRSHKLEDKRVLDVGSGRGYLQDMVGDYTGLDIAANARRYYHKPFVHASATDMPFRDGEFDALWSIWVLEHIPNPESALLEMRRVVKPGGLILLAPAWNCSSWAADGYEVRRFSDFGLEGKLTKLTIPVRRSGKFQVLYRVPIRGLRALAAAMEGPTTFHYRRLTPNYTDHKDWWVADSDAVNSMDAYEAALWFQSRGDKCLNCPRGIRALFAGNAPLVIQVEPGKAPGRAAVIGGGAVKQ
jgi:SAM-dependent methyltransferase